MILEFFSNRVILSFSNYDKFVDPLLHKSLAVSIDELPNSILIINFDYNVISIDLIPKSELEYREYESYISGSLLSYYKLLKNPNLPLQSVGLKLHGCLNFAESFKNLVENFNIDLEEELAKYVGDPIAYKLSKFVSDIIDRQKSVNKDLVEMLSDYLLIESNSAVPKEELDRFIQDVDNIRSDCARLTAKVNQLVSN